VAVHYKKLMDISPKFGYDILIAYINQRNSNPAAVSFLNGVFGLSYKICHGGCGNLNLYFDKLTYCGYAGCHQDISRCPTYFAIFNNCTPQIADKFLMTTGCVFTTQIFKILDECAFDSYCIFVRVNNKRLILDILVGRKGFDDLEQFNTLNDKLKAQNLLYSY